MGKFIVGLGTFGILLWFTIVYGSIFGYISNIAKLTKCDFKSPYKAEVLRGVGIIIAPMGIIEGYCKIKD